MPLQNPYFHPQRATETRCVGCSEWFPYALNQWGDVKEFCSMECFEQFEIREALEQHDADMIDLEQP
jgi:hypothetical protein